MGSFIDGFQDMEIKVRKKLSLIHVALVIRVQKNTLSKTLYYLLLILNKNLNAFKSRSFCFGLLYTAISRKVVGKSARDNPERHCGWF